MGALLSRPGHVSSCETPTSMSTLRFHLLLPQSDPQTESKSSGTSKLLMHGMRGGRGRKHAPPNSLQGHVSGLVWPLGVLDPLVSRLREAGCSLGAQPCDVSAEELEGLLWIGMVVCEGRR